MPFGGTHMYICIYRERKSGFNYYVMALGSPVYNISIVIFGFRVIVSISGFFLILDI